MQSDFSLFKRRFRDYAAQFRNADGTFDFPIRRKIEHTFDVCRTTEATLYFFATRRSMANREIFNSSLTQRTSNP